MIENNNWFLTLRPKQNAKIKLFCFHYAGGGASIFRSWTNNVIESAEVIAVQLPGREDRYNEALLTDIEKIIEKLCTYFEKQCIRQSQPFVFFGHSLGALVAFELIRKLRRNKLVLPNHLIVSGSKSPQITNNKPLKYLLPDEQFIVELSKYNGIPEEVLNNKELIKMCLPIIKADFTIIETYKYKTEVALTCPITTLGGLNDHTVNREHILAWKAQTNSLFRSHFLPGDHFFVKDSYKQVIQLINSVLNGVIA